MPKGERYNIPNIGEDEPGWVEPFRLEVGLGAFPGCFLGQSKQMTSTGLR